jgi:predicted lipoprotein with Yx(FWY)xxD motif
MSHPVHHRPVRRHPFPRHPAPHPAVPHISVRRHSVLLAGAGGIALLLSACGGGSSGGGATVSNSSSQAAGAASGAAAVTTHDGPLGSYLTDRSGRTLYEFAADSAGKSTCTGQCATFWPPLTTSGTPTATGGAMASLLGTTARSDGTTQVTYAGHPVYYFAEDTAAGDVKGQGNNGSGAKWWILGPDGSAITRTAAAAPSSSSAGSSWS